MAQRVLVVEAHPDDAEWYCGGTIAKLAQAGAEITFIICTEAEKGSYDPNANPVELARTRKREQEAARAFLGVREIVYLGIPDSELEVTLEMRKRLALLYRKYRPELLLTFDPWTRDELHPDHRTCGTVALDARLAAKMPLYYAGIDGVSAWATPELWLFGSDAPNHYVDVTNTFEECLAALKLHTSQSVWDAPSIQYVTEMAQSAGDKIDVAYGEAFHRLVIEGSITKTG